MNPYSVKVRVEEKYKVVGFISSGTYGRVYKAVHRDGSPGEFAIKKLGCLSTTDKQGYVAD